MRAPSPSPSPSIVVFFFAAMLAAVAPACFHPDQPACAFTCVDPSASCPPGFTCEADGICHDQKSQGVCTIDAGSDD